MRSREKPGEAVFGAGYLANPYALRYLCAALRALYEIALFAALLYFFFFQEYNVTGWEECLQNQK